MDKQDSLFDIPDEVRSIRTSRKSAYTEKAETQAESFRRYAALRSEDNDIVTYSWSLVNFGEEDGTFCAILAAFGEDPDFTKDSFVLALDHQELLAKSGSTLTGTCTVSKKLGKGDLKIKALVIDAKDKTVWLSR